MPAAVTLAPVELPSRTVDAAPAAPADAKHLHWIDWLRFLAAFAVMAEHIRAANWRLHFPLDGRVPAFVAYAFYSVTSLGGPAVVIFFVLSGWLVGGHALRKVRAGTFDAASYAADRLSRVYVPLVPALLLTAAIVRVADGAVSPSRYLGCLVGFQDIYLKAPGQNSPLWTLAYEFWFYVLAGSAAVACQRSRTRGQRVAAGAGVALAVAHCLLLQWTYCACWLLGVAGPWVRGAIAPRWRGWLAAAGALVLVAGTVNFQIKLYVLPGARAWMPPAPAAQLVLALGALVLAAALADLSPRTGVVRWLERAGAPLAAFSYTLYLTHYPVVWSLWITWPPMTRLLDGPSTLRYLLYVAISLAVALIMYGLFESRTPRVRRWLRARLATLPAGRSEPAATGADLATVV